MSVQIETCVAEDCNTPECQKLCLINHSITSLQFEALVRNQFARDLKLSEYDRKLALDINNLIGNSDCAESSIFLDATACAAGSNAGIDFTIIPDVAKLPVPSKYSIPLFKAVLALGPDSFYFTRARERGASIESVIF